MFIHSSQILFIEPDPAQVERSKQAFESANFNINLIFCHSLSETLELIKTTAVDLIISDSHLPDGECSNLLTHSLVFGQIPVIILASKSDETLAVSALKAGAIDYISKTDETIDSLPRITDRGLKQWRALKDHEKVEKDLIKSQSRLAVAQKIAQLGNWEWDFATNHIYCSDEIFSIFGIPNTQFQNGIDDLLQYIHADDRDNLKSSIENTILNKIPFMVECRVQQPQGSEFVVRNQGEVIINEHNEITHITGIMQNITRSHETFKQLHLLASALEASADSIIITDKTGTIVWANPAMSRLSGYKYSELVGETPHLWNSFANDKKIFGELWASIQAGESWSGELINRKKNGSEYLEEQTITSVFNEHGEISHFVAIKRDITRRKETESRDKQAAQVFEHSIEGILICDVNNTIIRINPAFSKITGYSEREIIGKKPNILRSGNHDDQFFDKMWKAINQQGVWQGEIWNRRKNGEIYPELLTISTLKDNNDKVIEYIAIFADITERKQDEAHIHRLAYYDNLTALPNRSLIHEVLKKSLALRTSETDLVGVLNIDIDRFFSINETMGHEAGDQLLQIIAKRITRCNEGLDKTARISGDEFSIVCPDITSANQLAKKAQDLLDNIAKPVMLNNQEIFVTASIGIAIAPTDGEHETILFRHAESARNHAKRDGNSYQFFNNEINAQGFEQLVMKSSLRRALERDEFILYYQPQVDIKTGKIVGAEALIRWQHPDLGLVPPGRFIPILEETGLIIDVGQWVIKTACEQNKSWQNQGYEPIQVGVNLSPRQFNQKELAPSIESIINETGLAPKWLDLEVTESSIMENPEKVIETLNQLHKIGIKISIDDFGTGYSSLSYLKTFPIDVLKIDQSFIRDITVDSDDEVIVKTIIAMGHNLGLKIVAEGVEQKEQLDIIRQYDCEWYQGYYFSKPVPADEFVRLLKK